MGGGFNPSPQSSFNGDGDGARPGAGLRRLVFLFTQACGDLSEEEKRFRRMNAHILSVVMLSLLLASILLNLREHNYALLPPLILSALPAALSLLWFRLRPEQALVPQILMSVALMLLGAYLLFGRGAPGLSSLLWFVIFPPMLMFSMGLRCGSILFWSFFLFLAVVLLTPLNGLLYEPVPESSRIRLLLALLGAYVFSLGTEYTRYATQKALTRAMARLETDARTDPLTGLGNRRDFYGYFDWIMARAARDGTKYALVMADIDHFKRVNDAHGHAIGDMMLCHVSGNLLSQLRASDRLFRWGGEEFVLLMPDSDCSEAVQVAERLRSHAESTPFRHGSLVIPYTLSLGVYSGREGLDARQPLREADDNLYAAKNKGRNQVCFSS